MPDKALTVSEVESIMKNDVVKQAATVKCGKRFLAWYENLRKSWK